MTRANSGGGFGDASVKSDNDLFVSPEIGFDRAVNDKLGLGLTVYGNGGMNTDYAGGQLNCGQGPANVLCGSGRLGVDLVQLIVAPTVAYRFNDQHAVGISPLLVHQRFKAEGLQAFAAGSSAPSNLTNNGTDTTNGLWVRLGYLGKITDRFSVGASYSPKIGMSKFSKYSGLFAEQGGFDIPANYTLGLSFQATLAVALAFDYQRIGYSGVKSVGNSSAQGTAPLGSANGPGFGWSDINVVKLGVQWQATPQLTVRGGFNSGGNPVRSSEVTFNILAPGVVTKHYTAGATYALSGNTEVSMSYMHAPANSVSGSSSLPFCGTEMVRMSQRALGIQFGWRY
jgi:long-chain fatty acid transport protein